MTRPKFSLKIPSKQDLFQKLPPELRNRIWSLVLSSERYMTCWPIEKIKALNIDVPQRPAYDPYIVRRVDDYLRPYTSRRRDRHKKSEAHS